MPTFRVPVRFRYVIQGVQVVEVEARTLKQAFRLAADNFSVNDVTDPNATEEEMEAEAVED